MFESLVVEDVATEALDASPPTPEDDAFIAMLSAAELDGTFGRVMARLAAERVTTAELGSQEIGVPLAALVSGADPEILDDYALVELVAAWSRLTSWTQAGAARAAAELARRESMTVPEARPLPGRSHRRRASLSSAAAHEVAMRLVITRSKAQSLIDVGLGITGPLQDVGAALDQGLIDLPRARAFTEGLAQAPLPVALDVQDLVLPTAPTRTVRQVTNDIARALVAVDPEEASLRHQAARDRRRVGRPTPLPDGMAGMWAVLPAADAVALDIALDSAARTAKASGDARSTDQLRADALASLGWTALDTGWLGAAPAPEDGRPAAAGRSRAHEGPGWPLGKVGGRRPHVRVTVPLGVLLPEGSGRDGPAPDEPAPDGPGRDGPVPDWPTPVGPDAGESAAPGPGRPVAELDRYGPVSPDVARALALGGTWSRLVTDPTSGLVRDVGRTRYQPPAELAELVRVRDGTCVRPGCGAAATGCDLDHTVPFHLGGPTAEWNLGALCPSDHAFKTAGALRVRQVEPGVFEFELPSGHRYRRGPDGSSRLLDDAGREEPAGRKGHAGREEPAGPPPF